MNQCEIAYSVYRYLQQHPSATWKQVEQYISPQAERYSSMVMVHIRWRDNHKQYHNSYEIITHEEFLLLEDCLCEEDDYYHHNQKSDIIGKKFSVVNQSNGEEYRGVIFDYVLGEDDPFEVKQYADALRQLGIRTGTMIRSWLEEQSAAGSFVDGNDHVPQSPLPLESQEEQECDSFMSSSSSSSKRLKRM